MTLRAAALGLAAAAVVAAAAGTLRMDTRRDVVVQESRDPALRMRASSPLLVPMFNQVVQYRVNVSIGTPPQDLSLAVDTGSSDVWVPDAGACGPSSKSACDGGFFTSASSSTFRDLGPGFDIEYVDRTGSKGDYISDVITVNGVKLDNFTMGLALSTTVDIGLLGIGYPDNEAGVATDVVPLHPTFVTALVAAGDISSVAYSLWLDDLQSSQGSILFGGIDTAKYSGTLALIDLYPSGVDTKITEFLVALTSVSATSSSGTDQLTPSGYAVGVVLDSGTTLTYVPQDLATVIFNEVGAVYNSTLGIATVPCSLATKGGTINFGFGGHSGPQVSVAMSQLVDPAKTDGGYLTDSDGKVVCRFGITLQPKSDSSSSLLFGDSFLRSAYVVYDLDNNQIGLAQTQFNATESNVVAFASRGAPIPSATVAPGAADVTAATASTVATSQSLSAAKGFQSAAARGLLPLGLWELAMFTFGVLLFTRLLGSRP